MSWIMGDRVRCSIKGAGTVINIRHQTIGGFDVRVRWDNDGSKNQMRPESLNALNDERCKHEDPKRRAWCVLAPGHKGKHQDSWGKRFNG